MAGDASPDGMQHLLGRARWDADGVRDDVRDYVTGRLADPQAVLVVDETGDLKKGTMTVGVQRQYTGTAGRIENAQVAVYLAYAAAARARADRPRALPAGSWTADPERCGAAGIPEDVGFATKPALAAAMITRALDAGVPAAGSPATRSTAATRNCAGNWRNADRIRPGRGLQPPCHHRAAQVPGRRTRRPRPGPRLAALRPGRAPRATATTTGH